MQVDVYPFYRSPSHMREAAGGSRGMGFGKGHSRSTEIQATRFGPDRIMKSTQLLPASQISSIQGLASLVLYTRCL
jgi:hypothetical protein